MATITTSAKDYAEIMKTYTPTNAKISQWEEYFLKPLQQQTTTNIENIQKQTAYDISGAFANYKKSELATLQASQLGTGFKQEVSEGLKNIYSQEFVNEKAEETAGISEELKSASETLESENKRLLKLGETYRDIDVATQDYLTSVKGYDIDDIYTTDITGKQSLTKFGSSAMQEAMYNDEEYLKYLKDNKLYDAYVENRTDLNKYMANLDESTFESTEEARNIIITRDIINKYKKLFGELEGMDETKPTEYLKAYKTKILEQGSLDVTSPFSQATIDVKGTKYNVDYLTINKLKDKDFVNVAKDKNVGDVFEYEGEVYKIRNKYSNDGIIELIKIGE